MNDLQEQSYSEEYILYDINKIRNALFSLGVAKTNLYQIRFFLKSNYIKHLFEDFGFGTFSSSSINSKIKVELLCNSVTIPGMTTTTNSTNSVYPGYRIDFPVGSSWHECTLSFIVDREMLAYKFFHIWLRGINPKLYPSNSDAALITKARFYDEIVQNLYIYQFPSINQNSVSSKNPYFINSQGDYVSKPIPEVSGKNTSFYARLIDAYPINLSSLNLSYDESSLNTFTVGISYRDLEFSTPKSFIRTQTPSASRSYNSNNSEKSNTIRYFYDFSGIISPLNKNNYDSNKTTIKSSILPK